MSLTLTGPIRASWDLPTFGGDEGLWATLAVLLDSGVLRFELNEPASTMQAQTLAVVERITEAKRSVALTVGVAALGEALVQELSRVALGELLVRASAQQTQRVVNELRALQPAAGVRTVGLSLDVAPQSLQALPEVLSTLVDAGIATLVLPIARAAPGPAPRPAQGRADHPAERPEERWLTERQRAQLAERLAQVDYSSVRVVVHDPLLWDVLHPGVAPQASDELIEIHNPTASEISLSHVYLSDFKTYYLVTQGTATPNSSDFLVKFPAGTSIAAGGYLVVSLEPAAAFQTTFGAPPDFDFDPNDLLAPAMEPAKGAISSTAGLSNGDEMVVLFFWDGSADLVKDVDYLLYGNTSDAMNKSSITVGSSTYLAETAEASQAYAVAHAAGKSLNRCVFDEGTETQSGSNGYLGHDETSENLDSRFWELATRTPGAAAPCPGDHMWSKDFGTTGQDELMAVASDSSGNVVITGWFRDSIDFGGGALADAGSGDIFVAKFDTNGSHVWSVKAGGAGFDGAWAATIDGSGDVYVTGIFESASIAFSNGPTLTNTGSADVFVAKLSGATGAHVWSKSASGAAYDRAQGIAMSGSNVVVGGFFESGTFNLGTDLGNGGQGDIFVTQLAAADGSHQFSKAFAGTNHDQVWDVDTDAAGDIYITGTFNSSALAIGATILATAGDFDVFAAQLSGIDGATKWAKSYGGTALDQGFGIAASGGSVALTGHFASSSVTFGAAPDTLTNNGQEDVYVAALQASDGSHTWSVNGNGPGDERGEAVAIDGSGNVFVAGFFNGTTLNLGGADNLTNTFGGAQVFVARFASAGGHVWSRSATAVGASTNKAMGISAAGGLYVGGFFGSSSINFGGAGDALSVSGVSDVFLAELQP